MFRSRAERRGKYRTLALFGLLLLVPSLLPFHAVATESYVLFVVWSTLGLVYFRALLRRDRHNEHEQRLVVWAFLLILILFAAMMWVSRQTEIAANDAVDRIYAYHQTHPEHDSPDSQEDRTAFLHEQAKSVSSTNTLYTMVSLGLFLVIITMLLNNYKETQELGEKLAEAEQEAISARKIAELKESISSLLDNMPGLTFTKDAETGVYLACNQGFADYAHKETPDGVAGLTDAEIFDPETAAHFVADDKLALSMDRPYIFYEDVPDAAGNQMRFQTTKLKFIDSTGRLCLLGICRDVTEMVRIQHENAMTKEAYENAVSSGIMYTHIAQTLARDYTDMFYVNLDTEEFIEYRRGSESSALSEMRRGWHFFSDCKAELAERVYPEDREAFLNAMNRRNLVAALERKDTFIMTYRQIGDNGPIYVSMKVSLMEDDKHFIIVGITNVDAEMREAMAKSEALAAALTAAEEANKAKTSFLSSMSHEIRTPMNAIIGLDTLALRDQTISRQTRDYLEKIGGSAKHLLNLINEILDMSRIESGRLVLRREVFSLSAMLEQMAVKEKKRAELSGLRILLAEDMEINAEIMMDILEMENIQADHAENGRIAVRMFAESAVGDYAAILMDVHMPEMDGLEAAAAIRAMDREDAKRIPIIALTANAFDEDVQRSLQAGMNAHLTKPIEPNILYQALGELIYQAQHRNEVQQT
ncbi:MAG: response regulator [Oscillospiraceae bacterium]|nr:response regulator [Oscillospiraceae bacterium]